MCCFPVSCFQVSMTASSMWGGKQPAPQWIIKKTEEDVSSVRDAVRSRSPASHIVHHQASDSNKAQVLARVRI